MTDMAYMATALAALGGLVVLMSIIGFYGGKDEKNWMLLGYFYVSCFLIMLMILFSISALAFQENLGPYVQHHWDDLTELKAQSCCKTMGKMQSFLESNFSILGFVGLISVVFMMYGCNCAVKILTVPIIMKNMLTVINVMFFVTAGGIMATGVFSLGHAEMEAGNQWIAIMFIFMSVFIILVAILGICGARNKSRSLLLAYIVGTGILLVIACCCGIGGFVFASSLDESYVKEEGNRIACTVQLHGCTNCTNTAYAVQMEKEKCEFHSEYFVPECTPEKERQNGCRRGVFGTKGFKAEDCKKAKIDHTGSREFLVVCEPPPHQVFTACRYRQDGLLPHSTWRCCGDHSDPNDVSCNYWEHTEKCGQCYQWSKRDIEILIESNVRLLGLISFLMIVFVVRRTPLLRSL
jgi:hypothetical protein